MIWGLVLVMGLVGCKRDQRSVKDFIPGTYVKLAQSQFSIAYDTLLISQVKNGGDAYLVTRKTGYRRLGKHKVFPVQHQVKRWTGIWDEKGLCLHVLQSGNVLLFQPDQNDLLNKGIRYRKL